MRIEIPQILDRLGGDVISQLISLIDDRMGLIHTTTIGIIESFDAEKQTAVIQPAIKRLVTEDTRSTVIYTAEKYPLLVNVPVVFPGGGDWFMTFPVKKGDECLIFSMERSIGFWKLKGGLQDPSNYRRKLSFKDAVAMVGIQSQASSLPSFNADEPELRNRDGDVKLTMTDSGITLMDETDNAVRYSALETAYNQLKTDLNNLVTKYNSDMALVAGGATAAVSASGLWLTPLVIGGASPSTGDITGAKVEEIKVP
jgi:hypothetical protein